MLALILLMKQEVPKVFILYKRKASWPGDLAAVMLSINFLHALKTSSIKNL